MLRFYWKSKRPDEGWLSFFNRKNSDGQTIDRRRVSLVTEFVRGLLRRGERSRERLDINDVIREVVGYKKN